MTSSGRGEGDQVKNGQNQMKVDDYRQGGVGRDSQKWMSRAIISKSVIRVQTVFQTSVWLCYKCSRLMSGSAISVPDRCLVLL